MFGDLFHGSCIFLFGLYLCGTYVDEEGMRVRRGGDLFRPLIQARYLILLMGFFSAYVGLIYNDYAGMTLNLFGSCYSLMDVDEVTQFVRDEGCVYPFGLDPAW